jgi:hypothetical protein
MEFFNVVEIEDCPTTSLKLAGRYFLADTINLSISVAKIATKRQKVYKVNKVESKKVKNRGK